MTELETAGEVRLDQDRANRFIAAATMGEAALALREQAEAIRYAIEELVEDYEAPEGMQIDLWSEGPITLEEHDGFAWVAVKPESEKYKTVVEVVTRGKRARHIFGGKSLSYDVDSCRVWLYDSDEDLRAHYGEHCALKEYDKSDDLGRISWF